uniref:Choline/ethanolamine kinase n=1 Tax=Acrobeloides nanus TaxID=290746 RepID=A0A914EH07_9BILA
MDFSHRLGSMKEVLSAMDPQADPNTHLEFKEKTHILCSRFLGGAWKTVSLENLKINRIKGGMSNMLFLCRLSENHPTIKNEPDKVLLRVYFNPETESHLVAESVIFTLLSERHLGPKLYGIFSGGRLEEYIPSRPLACREIAVPAISYKIAKRVARVHELEVPIWKEPDYLCDALERWLTQLQHTPSGTAEFKMPEEYTEWAPKTINCKELFEEVERLRELISKSKSPVSFCHNDLQEGNILLPKGSSGNIRLPSIADDSKPGNTLSAFNPMDPRLILIDFEYASYNYRGFDFANHFIEYSINYDVDEFPGYEMLPEQFPSDEHMFEFMLSYLQELFPNKDDASLQEKAHQMVEETKPFIPVSHIFWGVWGLLQVEVSPVDFGFAEYGRDRLGLYFKNKHLLKLFEI